MSCCNIVAILLEDFELLEHLLAGYFFHLIDINFFIVPKHCVCTCLAAIMFGHRISSKWLTLGHYRVVLIHLTHCGHIV